MTKGRNGANSRSCTCSAMASAARGRGGRRVAARAVGPLLDQLEVVVAERPRRTARSLQRRRCSRRPRRPRSPWSTTSARPAEHRPVDGSVTAAGVERRVAPTAEHELGGVEHLHGQPAADLHLALVEGGVQPRAGPSRRASGRRRRRTCPGSRSGTTTLPLDLLIFLRSGSTTKPEISACAHGIDVVLEVGADDAGEQPGADDLVRVRCAGPSGRCARTGRRRAPSRRRSAGSATTSPRCPSRRGRR